MIHPFTVIGPLLILTSVWLGIHAWILWPDASDTTAVATSMRLQMVFIPVASFVAGAGMLVAWFFEK